MTPFTYNYYGTQLVSQTNPDGLVINFGYDASIKPTTTAIDPSGLNLTTTFGYDVNGNVTSVTDPMGNASTIGYDAAGRLNQTIAPAPFAYVTIIRYDADGNANSVQRMGPPVQSASSTYTLSGSISQSLMPLGHSDQLHL